MPPKTRDKLMVYRGGAEYFLEHSTLPPRAIVHLGNVLSQMVKCSNPEQMKNFYEQLFKSMHYDSDPTWRADWHILARAVGAIEYLLGQSNVGRTGSAGV